MSSDFALYKKENGEADFIRSVWSGAHVPDDWSAVNIGQSTDIVGGKAFSSDNFSKDTERGIPLVKRKTVNNDQMPEEHLHTEFDNRYKVTKGDLLISMDRYFECMIWPYREAALNQRVCRVEPNDMINTRYLGYALQKPLKYLEELGGTTDFTSLSMSEFDFIELPIPPADEQVRIASVLYSVDEQLKMLHDRHDSLTQLKHGLMQDLLTGNTRVTPEMKVKKDILTEEDGNLSKDEKLDTSLETDFPQGWGQENLGNIVSMRNGKSIPKEDRKGGETPVYGGNGIMGYTDKEGFASEKTLVIGRVGAKCGNVHLTSDKCWISDNAILTTEIKKMNAFFLLYYLDEYELGRLSAGNAQDKVTQGSVASVTVPVPPLWEQERIASILYTVDEMIERTSELIDEYEHAKRGLMQDLLSGDVRTPEDLTALYTLRTDTDSMGAVDGGVTQTTLDI